MNEKDLYQLSSLELAYMGDAFYELYIREIALKEGKGRGVGADNKFAKKFSNAKAQALMAEELARSEAGFSEEELRIYKRGRNSKSVSAPKSCTISEYRRATGLEALLGYLYLKGCEERARELIELGLSLIF